MSLAKNISMLLLMNLAKMVFPLITLPYLTRVLSVDCFGLVAYVKAVMQYMQIFVDYGFMISGTKDIALARYDNDQLNAEVSNILLARLFLSVIGLMILVVMAFILPILKGNFLFALLSYMVVILTCFLFDYLFRGLEKMEVITKRFVVMRGIAVLLTFFFVKSDSDILWIPILDILGSIIAVILVFIQLHKMKIVLIFHFSNDVFEKIKESTVFFFNTVAVTAFMALNTIVIGIYLPIKEVAFWSLSLQIISAGQSFFTPITEGIYPRMIISKDFNIIKRVLKIFVPIVVLGCIVTYFAAPMILHIIGGIQYIDATSTLRALIPVLFFGFTTMLFGWPTLGALGKARDVTFCTMITAFLQILGLIVLVNMGKLTILNISWLRGITEFINTCLRALYICAYRYKGDIDCGKWTRN